MVDAHHGVHPARPQRRQTGKGTEAPVRQHHIAFLECGQEFLQQAAIMFLERAFHPLQQRAAGQAEARREFDDGKTAAGLLRVGLRPGFLVGECVRHGKARAVHHLDAAAQPEFGRRDAGGEFVSQRLVQFGQPRQRQPVTRLTISARAAVGRLILRRIPRLDFADDLAAGSPRTQDLTQERPKGQRQRIGALATVDPFGGGREQRHRQPRPENLAQPAQGRLTPLLRLRAQRIELGTALSPEKMVGNPWQKRCVLVHPPD